MKLSQYNILDTLEFEKFIGKQNDLKKRYNDIQKRYTTIVDTLMKDWKGHGADAFYNDSKKVVSNLRNIGDILSTMCDTLSDCYDVFKECDTQLGKNNREI